MQQEGFEQDCSAENQSEQVTSAAPAQLWKGGMGKAGGDERRKGDDDDGDGGDDGDGDGDDDD